jgi:AraC-like DNA-binding protein
MSPRNLQYRLARHDTTFHALVDDTRATLARAYVEDRSRTLSEITYLLGFSSAGNLSRAFERWTGTAPGAVRGAGRIVTVSEVAKARGAARRGPPAVRADEARGPTSSGRS